MTYTVHSPGAQRHGTTNHLRLTVDRHTDDGFVSTSDPRVDGRDDLSWKVDTSRGRAWAPTHVCTKGRAASPVRTMASKDVSVTVVDPA